MRLDKQKPAVGALQIIFVKWVSSGHLLVLKNKVSLHVLAASSGHIFAQILRVDYT